MMSWDDNDFTGIRNGGIDTFLQGKSVGSPAHRVVRGMIESKTRQKVSSGTRVSFRGNLEALLSYPGDSCPEPGMGGTVIRVRTSSGDSTEHYGGVYVLWDDGEVRSVHREHLKRAKTSRKELKKFRRRTSNLGDLSAFFNKKKGSGDLIHKSSEDLWAVQQDGDSFIIERLFDDTGSPLKV